MARDGFPNPGSSAPGIAADREGLAVTHRERWLRTVHYRPVDHVPDEEPGYQPRTLRAWQAQGLPPSVTSDASAWRFFGCATRAIVPARSGPWPSFDEHSPAWDDAELPLRDRSGWERLKARLDPAAVARYPDNWEALRRAWRLRDYPLGLYVGGLWGGFSSLVGAEAAPEVLGDDPGLARDVLDRLARFSVAVVRRALEDVDFDFAIFWEPMGSAEPGLAPHWFREVLVPPYRHITEVLAVHGVDLVIAYCDADVTDLAALWLEGGVRGMLPLQRAAGTDPERLRDRFGERILLFGGIDGRALARGADAVRPAVEAAVRLAERGGYIPHVDGPVPPGVSLTDYLGYLRIKREVLGIPLPDASAPGATRGPAAETTASPRPG